MSKLFYTLTNYKILRKRANNMGKRNKGNKAESKCTCQIILIM